MRILMINQVFYPDVAATAQHAHDLARHLVRYGHEVHVIASRSIYGGKGASLPKRETVDGIHIHRVGKSLFGKSGIVARAMDFALFYVAAAAKAITVPKPDVVICFTTPPFIAMLGLILRALRGSRAVYWVMDLYPDVAVATGVLKPRSLSTRLFERLNRRCLRRSDRTVVLGRCMEELVRSKGVDHGQVVRVGVWSDEGEVQPIPRESNPYRAEWEIGDRFVVMYSGNFGLAHDIDTMCGMMDRMRGDDLRFAMVGGGKKKAAVDEYARAHQLSNVVLAPYQPRERLDASLSCADVHLVSVLEGLEGMIVPCKLFGIMAAARPTVYIGHPSSEIARVLTDHDCGLIVRQGDIDGLVDAVERLRTDEPLRVRMGENARRALSEVYDRDRACEAWRALLEGLAEQDAPSGRGVTSRRAVL